VIFNVNLLNRFSKHMIQTIEGLIQHDLNFITRSFSVAIILF